jgi:hypothetical protein
MKKKHDRIKTCFKILIAVIFIPIIKPQIVYAQASLASDDIKDLVIVYNGKSEDYTILRDAINRSQWYYIPKSPRLNENNINGTLTPEFSLLRYQFVDPASPGHSYDGGIAQFAVVLTPEADEIKALRDTLVNQLNVANIPSADLSLSALPIKSATASIYSPSDNKLLSNIFGSGLYPLFASQKAPFVLYLTRWGADINDALIGHSVTSATGIPIAITFTFQGLTPPASIHIKANYRKIFNHYSSDKAFAAKASYFGLFGASSQMRWSTINENLSVDGALTVTKIGSSDIDETTMDAVMQAVMKRINDNIFQAMSPPTAISPASADMPSVNERFAGAGYNASFKTVNEISNIDDEFDWTERKIVDRTTLAGGFVGLGQYSQAIRDNAVKFVPTFDWDLAYFILPAVGQLQELTQVVVNTQLVNNQDLQHPISAQSGIWTSAKGWRSIPDDNPITTLDFAIAPSLNNGVGRNNLQFITTTTVTQADINTISTDTSNVVQGGIPVAPPVNSLRTIFFDPGQLQFNNINSLGKLIRVGVTMTIGTNTFSNVIQPLLKDGKYALPNQLVWVVKKDDIRNNHINVTLSFDYISGSTPLNRMITINDLSAIQPNLNYLIRDPNSAN